MKKILISILRDRTTSIEGFRTAADQLSNVMAIESAAILTKTTTSLETPMAPTHGVRFKPSIMLVPILRSGLVMLPAFLRYHPTAHVGFIGAHRDEVTALPKLDYSNLPQITKDHHILVLDPMIATGGSASMASKILKKAGAIESQITMVSFIAASEGLMHFQEKFPDINVIVAQVDDKLDKNKFIVPGLGDFGDRFFGTESE